VLVVKSSVNQPTPALSFAEYADLPPRVYPPPEAIADARSTEVMVALSWVSVDVKL
jgi:hypothetical protein